MANLEELDEVFSLSDKVTADPRLRAMYEILIHRMKNECRHLPMSTPQMLLVERIAATYVSLRDKEQHGFGTAGGFVNSTSQKDFSTHWLTMTRELNAQMRDADKMNREAFLQEILAMIRETLGLEEPTVRDRLMNRFAAKFEEAGV